MTGPFTLALDTFGKSFRRNIIQRGVKLQPRRSFGRIFQLTTLFRNGYGPMRVACARICLYVPLSSSLSDSTNVSRVDEATHLFLPFYFSFCLSLSLFCSIVWVLGDFFFFFFFTCRAYQSPAATRRNAISIFRHRMENLVTMLRRSPFNGGIFNAIATNAPRASGLQSRASPRKWNSFEMDCKIDPIVTRLCNFVHRALNLFIFFSSHFFSVWKRNLSEEISFSIDLCLFNLCEKIIIC